MNSNTGRQVLGTGFMFGADAEFTTNSFDPNRPCAWCFMCGALFQSAHDRVPGEHSALAIGLQNEWRVHHNRQHSEQEHANFNEYKRTTGCSFTPEAAYKLAPFGFVPVVDMVMNPEVEHACNTAPRAPQEGVLEHYAGR